jgi:two-component system nitrate/nitrite response regulator NarL
VLIEDSRLARDQLAALLDAQPHLEVVATAPSVATGLTLVHESRPAGDDIVGFIEAGADGFILNDADAEEIVGTIRRVAQGIAVLPARLTSTLFSHFAGLGVVRTAREAPGASVRLTTREREVIELIADGRANKEIARRLGITTHTVKCHVHHIMGKLDLHSRLQLAAHAHQAAARPSEL